MLLEFRNRMLCSPNNYCSRTPVTMNTHLFTAQYGFFLDWNRDGCIVSVGEILYFPKQREIDKNSEILSFYRKRILIGL